MYRTWCETLRFPLWVDWFESGPILEFSPKIFFDSVINWRTEASSFRSFDGTKISVSFPIGINFKVVSFFGLSFVFLTTKFSFNKVEWEGKKFLFEERLEDGMRELRQEVISKHVRLTVGKHRNSSSSPLTDQGKGVTVPRQQICSPPDHESTSISSIPVW